MVAPCDKYQGLVVGPDGQTVADPYGYWPSLGDYEEWRQVAANLIDRAQLELDRETALVGENRTEAQRIAQGMDLAIIRDAWAAMGGAFSQSFAQFDALWSASIMAMVEIAKRAACQIGIIEARIITEGGEEADIPTPPVVRPGGKSGKAAKTGGLGVGLLALGALFLFTRD